jgi:hypothetical protein
MRIDEQGTNPDAEYQHHARAASLGERRTGASPSEGFPQPCGAAVGNATAWRRWRTRVLPLAQRVASELAHTCAIGVCRAGMTLGARRA